MAAAGALPRFLALYSEKAGKYLSYTSEGGKLNRILAAKGPQATSPHAKFELVPSEVHPTMVHIRCCYNNRFLTRRSETEWWIVAAADEPVDDHSNWSSTLFAAEARSSSTDDKKKIVSVRLLHVQLGRYAQWYDDSTHQYSMCVWAQSTNPAEPKAEFQIVDWETLIELPRVLSFKGSNGRYLGLAAGGHDVNLQFIHHDPANVTVVQEVSDVTVPNNGTNNILIKNSSNSGMWVTAASNSYALAMAGHEGEELTPIKVNGDTIALRHFKTRMFFRLLRHSILLPTYHLAAVATEIVPEAHLVVTDLLPARTIDGIKFNLPDGWLSDVTPGVVLNAAEPVINETDETQILEVKIPYADGSSKSTWKATTPSFKKGPVAGIKPDQIPYVVNGTTTPARIEMGTPFVPSFVWGGTTPAPTHQVKAHKVTLPPWTKATVKLSATAATCNVPFSYTRYDGEDESSSTETYIMEDGLYTGTNYFDFKFEDSAPEPIPKKL